MTALRRAALALLVLLAAALAPSASHWRADTPEDTAYAPGSACRWDDAACLARHH